MSMTVHPVQFSDEGMATPRAIRPSAPALLAGDAVDVRVSERPERWRTTRIAEVRPSLVRLMGVVKPKRTGLVCPWCGEGVGQLQMPRLESLEAYCPGCGHEWVHARSLSRS